MLKDNFCSSPWYHVKLASDGNFWPCRWAWTGVDVSEKLYHVSEYTLTEFLQSDRMNAIRSDMLEGKKLDMCETCNYEQNLGKVSGRQRQLLKSGITEKNFTNTFCNSKHFDWFTQSHNTQGQTTRYPTDLQIDLGNTCNSSCIMCKPIWSSRVQQHHEKLHKVEPAIFEKPIVFKNWSDDKQLVEKFVNGLEQIGPDLKYVHFLGGETLYMQAFWDISTRMIDIGLANNTTIGITTNCTLYNSRVESMIKKFKTVNLGLSIESVTPLNDYIRWPAEIEVIKTNIKKYIALREDNDLHLSLRITPNVLSIYHLDQLIDWMIENDIMAESCNILCDPVQLKTELLPDDLRQDVLHKLNSVVNKHGLQRPKTAMINRRIQKRSQEAINNVIFEYIDFVENYKELDNITEQRKNLVKYLSAYENMRDNNILEYLPEYEKFLRSHGYQR